MRKIAWHILPLVFLLYIVAFIDRANVAYAKLTMTVDLGFSEAVYGFGAGVFFIGYLVLEIPGALIVQRWGARWWITSHPGYLGHLYDPCRFRKHAGTSFFLLHSLPSGCAEAGFFPGIIVYLNQWFPTQYRARAMARFVVASPVALAIGGPIAAPILGMDAFGLAGWRWLFILEGVPAIVLGLLTPILMINKPQDATSGLARKSGTG